jgi:hypothetical protein
MPEHAKGAENGVFVPFFTIQTTGEQAEENSIGKQGMTLHGQMGGDILPTLLHEIMPAEQVFRWLWA